MVGAVTGDNRRRTPWSWLVVVLAAAAGTVAVAEPATPVTATFGAPPERRVAVFSDSVGLGARYAIPDAFPADWEVNVVGEPARFVEQLVNGPCYWTLTRERCDVNHRLAVSPHWFGDHVVVAAGYNYPYWDPDRFDRSVDLMVDTLVAAGVEHVHWVTLREVKREYVSASAWRQVQPYSWYFPEVNDHLEAALDRHPELTLVDWAAVADRTGITYDAIHLNNEGAALYASLVRESVYTAATRVPDGSTTRISVPDGERTSAVAVNLTTTQPRRRGFLTAWDCSLPRPVVSSHNFVRGQTVAHSTVVPVGAGGEICVYASSATNLIVDLAGRFTGEVTDDGAGRLSDTRRTGRPVTAERPLTVPVDSPDEAAVSVFTLTGVGATGRGWVRLAPCGSTATTSNLNVDGPAANPNAVVARPVDGRLCANSSVPVNVVVDRLVTFADPAAFEVDTPERVADTRRTGALPAGGVLRLSATALGTDDPADTTVGLLLNVTGTRSGRGNVAVYGCDDGRPATSSLNLTPAGTVANFVVVAPDADGEVCLRTSAATDLVVDLQGRVVSGFEGDQRRLLDSRLGT